MIFLIRSLGIIFYKYVKGKKEQEVKLLILFANL